MGNDIITTYQQLGGVAWNFQFNILSITNINNEGDIKGESLDGFNNAHVRATKLPSKKLNAAKVPYGPFEFHVPMNTVFPENTSWSITFLGDKYGAVRRIYEQWQNDLYNFNTNKVGGLASTNIGGIKNRIGGIKNRLYSIKLATGDNILEAGDVSKIVDAILQKNSKFVSSRYPQGRLGKDTVDYITKNKNDSKELTEQYLTAIGQNVGLDIKTVDGINTTTSTAASNQTYTLFGCYPIQLDGISFSVAESNLITFTVTLGYQYFTVGN